MRLTAIASLLMLTIAWQSATAVTIDTVPVGDPGNAPDTSFLARGLGAVGYEYRIGTYEVTNDQYAEFLNAKAGSDPLQLYDTHMSSSIRGGIVRSNASPNFTYATKPNMGNKPVNFVSFWDAARFANWLYNGQSTGNTETGSYSLGGVLSPSSLARARTPGATWVVPNEDEWVKAAYYDPRGSAQGGPPGDDHYWLYPTASDSTPTVANADSDGDISNPGPNVANFFGGADWNGLTSGNVTTVGSAGPLSKNYYGTLDQAGNVAEWSIALIGQPALVLGGAFIEFSNAQFLTELCRNVAAVSSIGLSFSGDEALGFRLAYVPEPSSLVLALAGFAGLMAWSRRRKR